MTQPSTSRERTGVVKYAAIAVSVMAFFVLFGVATDRPKPGSSVETYDLDAASAPAAVTKGPSFYFNQPVRIPAPAVCLKSANDMDALRALANKDVSGATALMLAGRIIVFSDDARGAVIHRGELMVNVEIESGEHIGKSCYFEPTSLVSSHAAR